MRQARGGCCASAPSSVLVGGVLRHPLPIALFARPSSHATRLHRHCVLFGEAKGVERETEQQVAILPWALGQPSPGP